MQEPPPKRALIVFARTPQTGHCKTRLIPLLGANGALHAHVELLLSTLERLQGLRLRKYLYMTEASPQTRAWGVRFGFVHATQTGSGLGQRMAQAITEGFAAGATEVCLMGTDCPTISAEYVTDAFDKLATTDVVLGPAEDGGYGLIGLRNRQPAVFDLAAWSHGDVLLQTRQRLAELELEHHLLSEIWDVDTPADWRRYLQWRAT